MKREASWTSPKFYQEKREKNVLQSEIEEGIEDFELQLERGAKTAGETSEKSVAMPPLRGG